MPTGLRFPIQAWYACNNFTDMYKNTINRNTSIENYEQTEVCTQHPSMRHENATDFLASEAFSSRDSADKMIFAEQYLNCGAKTNGPHCCGPCKHWYL
jgi:hypothetical protein